MTAYDAAISWSRYVMVVSENVNAVTAFAPKQSDRCTLCKRLDRGQDRSQYYDIQKNSCPCREFNSKSLASFADEISLLAVFGQSWILLQVLFVCTENNTQNTWTF
jgi:hypothetical protein